MFALGSSIDISSTERLNESSSSSDDSFFSLYSKRKLIIRLKNLTLIKQKNL
jgi:hypothetical protein